MAFRSTVVKFDNRSDVALQLRGSGLDHGIWTDRPPAEIASGSKVSWASESSGVGTGTEGWAEYWTTPGSWLRVHWDNPAVGSNAYHANAPVAYAISVGGGRGDNATVEVLFNDASSTRDGIPDTWKRDGVQVDMGAGKAKQFVDLPAMGADVNRPDIFLQLDWMGDATHDHRVPPAAIAEVVAAFDAAPFISATGSQGITLHVDAGPHSIMDFATGATWGDLSRARNVGEILQLGSGTVVNGNMEEYKWDAFDAIRDADGGFTSTGRTGIFRYAISGHQLGTASNSGIARDIPGSDMLITLGTFTTTLEMWAGTLMHELGHLLGLRHGGDEDINSKPNYLSVMNYRWQMIGLTRAGVTGVMDYSPRVLPTLDENALVEADGLGPDAAGDATTIWVPPAGPTPGFFAQINDGSQPINWNHDANTGGLSQADINGDGVLTRLHGFNDWANVKLKGGSVGGIGAYVPPARTSHAPEITPAVAALTLPPDLLPPVTTITVLPGANAAGWHRTPVEVQVSAIDDISGVAVTRVEVDDQEVVPPAPVSAEGRHVIRAYSVDHSQNAETPVTHQVKLDLRAPDLILGYDPVHDEIQVSARDALSGTAYERFDPISVEPVIWRQAGMDRAERRTYLLSDVADNTTQVVVEVRRSPFAWEANVMEWTFHDHRFSLGEVRKGMNRRLAPPNTYVAERVTDRATGTQVLGTRTVAGVGSPTENREPERVVRTRHDVLDDLTIVEDNGVTSDRRGAALAWLVGNDDGLDIVVSDTPPA